MPKAFPIDLRRGDAVRGEVTDGAAELALQAKDLQLQQLPLQPGDEDLQLFSDRRRCRRLAMGQTEERHLAPPARQTAQIGEQRAQRRPENITKSSVNEQAVGEVIHVFAGEAEMDEFKMFFETGNIGCPFLVPII